MDLDNFGSHKALEATQIDDLSNNRAFDRKGGKPVSLHRDHFNVINNLEIIVHPFHASIDVGMGLGF